MGSFTTAQDGKSKKNAFGVGISSRPSQVVGDKDTTELRDRISSRVELQSLVATQLGNDYSFSMKEVILEEVGETSFEAIKACFDAVSIGIKNAFLRFIKMAITYKAHHELINEITQKLFERWT